MGWPMTIFMCLFLTPFVVIGVGLIIHTLMMLFGSTVVKIAETGSSVSAGFPIFRFRKKFNALNVSSVKHEQSSYSRDDQVKYFLTIHEFDKEKPVKFGRYMNLKQRDQILVLLRAVLLHKKLPRHTADLYWLRK